MPKLILIRHGQSQWNLENRFTGWWDVDVTEKGITEAREAGKLMLAKGIKPTLSFWKMLSPSGGILNMMLGARLLICCPSVLHYFQNMKNISELMLCVLTRLYLVQWKGLCRQQKSQRQKMCRSMQSPTLALNFGMAFAQPSRFSIILPIQSYPGERNWLSLIWQYIGQRQSVLVSPQRNRFSLMICQLIQKRHSSLE